MTFLQQGKDGVLIHLHVQPRASRTALVGKHGEALKIAVSAPPVDNAANETIQEFLAELFGIAKSKVELIRGEASRKKTFQVTGLGLASVKAKIEEKIS